MKIDGKIIASKVFEEIRPLVQVEAKRVAFIIFKNDPNIEAFVSLKMKMAERLGIRSEVVRSEVVNTADAVEAVRQVSETGVDGIVVQLPLPEGLRVQEVLDAVPVKLDIDVIGTASKEAFRKGETMHVPPVTFAVQEILKDQGVELSNKKNLILGKGRLVGEPIALWLERENIKFAQVDKDTNEEEILKLIAEADVIFSGIGVPHFIKPDMIKDGVVLIDAGTSEDGGVLKGDVDPACEAKALLYTPVPGGVGPITVAGLFKNLFL